MKKTTRFFAAFLAALMLLITITPTTAQATETPYCRISYDANVGCTTVKYYSYVNGVAKYDPSHLVKIDGTTLRMGTSNTQVTQNYVAGSAASWYNHQYFIFMANTDNCYARDINTGNNIRLAQKISAINLNYDEMAETVTFKNGNSVTISSLIKTATSSSSSSSSNNNSSSNSGANVSVSANKVTEYTDSNGDEVFKFGKYTLKVAGKNITLGKFKLSEMCNSGVKFVCVTKQENSNNEYFIFLYEDADKAYYRFDTTDIFNPVKLFLDDNAKLLSVKTDSNGFGTKLVTSGGIYALKDLTPESDEIVVSSYAINKKNYSTLYNGEKSYTLKRTNGVLKLGSITVASGLSSASKQFGFKGDYIHFILYSNEYRAHINTPWNLELVEENVTQLTFSTGNGWVNGNK